MIRVLNENITYEEMVSIDPMKLRLVKDTLPNPSEIYVPKTEQQIKNENVYESKTSYRNPSGFYLVATESDSILLNIIPKKRIITDSSISYIINNRFTYFEAPSFVAELPDPFVLDDGTIFRVTGEGVLAKELYTYYTIEDGILKKLPNYKTVEVMLFERGKTLDEIRVIEPIQFEDIVRVSLTNKLIQEGMSVAEAEEEVARLVYQG